MKNSAIAIALVALLAASGSAEPEKKSPPKVRPPVEVVRSFFIAMLTNDEAGVRKEILPNPNAEVLWQGQPPPAEALPQIKKQFGTMTCREYKVGEIMDLPGNRKLKVTDQMVNENSKMLLPIIGGEPMPTPLPVVKVEGQWKVDAESLIAARLAARRIREKEASNK